MPQRRKVPCLQELTLDNIVRNVNFHSRMFRTVNHDEEIFFRYETFRHIFGDELLKNSCLQVFTKIETDASILKFVLGRHTRNVSLHFSQCPMTRTSEEITSYILSNCKAAKYIDLGYSYLKEGHFLQAVKNWKSVVKLDLSVTSCTDRMICSVWDNLNNLEELCLNHAFQITDSCLQHLCKNSSNNGTYLFCEKNTFCGTLGRKLKCLSVMDTKITDRGIKFALVHLHSLQYLHHTGVWYIYSQALRTLTNDILSRNGTSVSFKLKHLVCPEELSLEELRTFQSACPHLESLAFSASSEILEELGRNVNESINSYVINFEYPWLLYSWAFRGFLLNCSPFLEKLEISCSAFSVNIRNVIEVLNICGNLKKLVLFNLTLIPDENLDVSEITRPTEMLEVFDFSLEVIVVEDAVTAISQMLARMTNLRILKIPPGFIQGLFKIDFGNNLCRLEMLHIHETDMRGVSLDHFLKSQNSFKGLVLRNCGHTDGFLRRHRDIVRKNNQMLKIECQADQVFHGQHSMRRYWYRHLDVLPEPAGDTKKKEKKKKKRHL